MYKVIGVDGREYGPVTAETVREWIAQGRANRHTRARLEGALDWTALGEIPEFAPLLESAVPPPPPPSFPGAGAPPAFGQGSIPVTSTGQAKILAEQILAQGRTTRVSSCLGRGWDLMLNNFWLTVGASTIIVVLVWATTLIPVVGSLLLSYVLLGGLDWMILRLARGEPAELGDCFGGFGKSFVPLMIFSLLSQTLFMLGLALFILPGFYVMVVYMLFPALLVMDKGLDFWPAMEVSRHVAQRHFWPLLGLTLLACLGLVVGMLLCVVGSLVATAWFTAAIVYAYEDLFGRAPLALPPLGEVKTM